MLPYMNESLAGVRALGAIEELLTLDQLAVKFFGQEASLPGDSFGHISWGRPPYCSCSDVYLEA